MLLIGCGGLGSNVLKSMAQMGFGFGDVVDPDIVEVSNLSRQNFVAADVGRPKAHSGIRNAAAFATLPIVLRSYWMPFQEFIRRPRPRYDILYCAIDDIPAMVGVARYARQLNVPVVFSNVSEDGDAMRVFVQRPSGACLACAIPAVLTTPPVRKGCEPSPAIADILMVANGFAVRALVGELLGEPIGDYNRRELTLSGFDIKWDVQPRPDCEVCHG